MAGQLTVTFENRSVAQPDQTITYELHVGVILAAGGIDPNIFMHAVNDDTSLADEFQRVASLQDVAAYLSAKVAAVARGDTIYRLSNAIIKYDDSDIALQAQTAVREAIDKYIADFNEFTGSVTFTTVVLSGVDQAYLDSLKADYATLSASIAEKEALEESIQLEIDTTQELVISQAARISNAEAARAAVLANFSTFYRQMVTQYTGQLGWVELVPPHPTDVQTYLTDASTQLANIQTNLGAFDVTITDERNVSSSLYQTLETKNQEQQQTSVRLLEDRRAADLLLAAIIQLEPTFNGS